MPEDGSESIKPRSRRARRTAGPSIVATRRWALRAPTSPCGAIRTLRNLDADLREGVDQFLEPRHVPGEGDVDAEADLVHVERSTKAFSRSALVMIPTRRSPESTGRAPNFSRARMRSASSTESSGVTDQTSSALPPGP